MTALLIIFGVLAFAAMIGILWVIEYTRPEPTRGHYMVDPRPANPEPLPPPGQQLPPVVMQDLPD